VLTVVARDVEYELWFEASGTANPSLKEAMPPNLGAFSPFLVL